MAQAPDRVQMDRKEARQALQWLASTVKLTKADAIIMRWNAGGGWEWVCGGQERKVKATGTWPQWTRCATKPLEALGKTLGAAPAVVFDKTADGFKVDGLLVKARFPMRQPLMLDLAINTPDAMVLKLLGEHGESELVDAGYGAFVKRAKEAREDSLRTAMNHLSPLGVSPAAVERMLENAVERTKPGLIADQVPDWVEPAIKALEPLAPFGVSWGEMAALAGRGR
ncbi:MAG: hypothetical protein ACKVZJ_12370 [Phycisphaerales bacterium]